MYCMYDRIHTVVIFIQTASFLRDDVFPLIAPRWVLFLWCHESCCLCCPVGAWWCVLWQQRRGRQILKLTHSPACSTFTSTHSPLWIYKDPKERNFSNQIRNSFFLSQLRDLSPHKLPHSPSNWEWRQLESAISSLHDSMSFAVEQFCERQAGNNTLNLYVRPQRDQLMVGEASMEEKWGETLRNECVRRMRVAWAVVVKLSSSVHAGKCFIQSSALHF